MAGYKIANADQLACATQNKIEIIDVRTHAEHAEKHLAHPHIHIPMDELTSKTLIQKYHLNKDSDLYILCLGGKRAAIVANKLTAEGFLNVHVIEGGLMACEKCGHALHKNT